MTHLPHRILEVKGRFFARAFAQLDFVQAIGYYIIDIAQAAHPEKNSTCVAVFSLNGVSFALKTWYKGDMETNRRVLCQGLDGFQI